MKKGYYLSAEAILTIILLGILITVPVQQTRTSLLDLHIYKKENDLLLTWIKQFDTINKTKMKQEFEKTFPNKTGKIMMDTKEIQIGKQGTENIASRIRFLDKNLQEHELIIIVFK